MRESRKRVGHCGSSVTEEFRCRMSFENLSERDIAILDRKNFWTTIVRWQVERSSSAFCCSHPDALGVLSQLHALGYVWRDCKPTNILVSGSQLSLIDFEGACRVSEIGIPPWGSIDYLPPCYRNEFAIRRAGTLEDDYALGVIAFQLFSGKSPSDNATTRKKIYDQMGCPATLRTRIECFLTSQPHNRPW